MKKVTILSHNLDVGGIERYISLLSKMLENDYEIEIVSTFKYNEKPAFNFSKKIKITYLIDGRPDLVSVKKLIKEKKYISVLKEIINRFKLTSKKKRLTKDVIKNKKTDYILTTRVKHHLWVYKYLDFSKTKAIMTEHNFHNNDKKYIAKLVKCSKKFHTLVLCTLSLKEYYEKIMYCKCVYIPNVIESVSNKDADINSNYLISVGRLSPEKGFLDLIDVFKLIKEKKKDMTLYLIGEGYERERLEQKIKSLGLEKDIILTGNLNSKELEKYYLKSSIYLMSSFTEIFGLVLIEAMNYGLTCVAFSSADGAKYLLKDNVGYLIENRDKNKMAKTVIELLSDREQLKEKQKFLHSYVEKFSMEKVKVQWIELFKKLGD